MKLASVFVYLSVAVAELLHVVHERRTLDGEWSKGVAVEGEEILRLRIALTQSNLAKGHDMLMQISDPDSPEYGRYYTQDQIDSIFAPSEESVAAVWTWLQENGVPSDGILQSPNKQSLFVYVTALHAEELLRTKFFRFHHPRLETSHVGCDEYSLHEGIRPHVQYVTPGVSLPMHGVRKLRHQIRSTHLKPRDEDLADQAASGNPCSTYTTPACTQSRYNFTKNTMSVKGNDLGIWEQYSSIDHKDMDLFYSHYAPYIPNGTFPTFDGYDKFHNNASAYPGSEAIIDFQVAYPIVYPQGTIWFEGGVAATGPGYQTFFDAVGVSNCTHSTKDDQCAIYNSTYVLSFSANGAEYQGGVSQADQIQQCNEFMKLGLRGVTVVFASGDDGPGCESYVKPPRNIFSPGFPANCPYVTVLGATQFTASGGEIAASFSSGGFSNIFPQPSYQAQAVAAYLRSPAAPTYPSYNTSQIGNGLFNRSGRAYPDVSAVGVNYPTYFNGSFTTSQGTSLSTPLFASLITRINGERIKAGKSTLGFINPVLYKNAKVFVDITKGSSKGGCDKKGFNAGKGWDPVTGLGRPDYPALSKLFLSLP